MYCYKPQPRDYRQPQDASYKLTQKLKAVADVLGLQGKELEKMCIGFADESSPQIQANTARIWSFERGLHKIVNTDRKKRNCFGFYALRGNSLICPIGQGNQEAMIEMLQEIKQHNQQAQTIVVIWDNHRSHTTADVEAKAQELDIVLVNLPVYSPDLNPIERIWKQVKRAISEKAFIKSVEELEQIIFSTFERCCQQLSFARSWIKSIFNHVFTNCPIQLSEK